MPLMRRAIETAIADISIAALRSWLKSQGLPHTANTREQLVNRLLKLFEKGKLSDTEFENGLISIEEASAKRVTLYSVSGDDRASFGEREALSRRVRRLGISLSGKPKRAPHRPPEPSLVYMTHNSQQIRAKWAETQVRVKFDLATTRFTKEKTTKTIVLVADNETGIVQLRYDKPEHIHSHRDSSNQPDDTLYTAYYFNQATQVLGTHLIPLDLRGALRSLVETEPRVVRVEAKDFRTGSNSRVRFASRGDVRDDDDWKAMHAEGGKLWAYDREFVHWLPERSDGKLTRQVFTAIDARTGRLRVEADCHEGELEYAISKIREHQSKVSQAQPPTG